MKNTPKRQEKRYKSKEKRVGQKIELRDKAVDKREEFGALVMGYSNMQRKNGQ